MHRIRSNELRIGDVIRIGDGAYLDTTVYRIADGKVFSRRPYITIGLAEIPYIGMEEFTIEHAHGQIWDVVERRNDLHR